jgi:hypothetical protein
MITRGPARGRVGLEGGAIPPVLEEAADGQAIVEYH